MFDSKKFLSDVSHEPGVYRMYDDKDQVIYVGKAKDLKSAFQLFSKKLKQQKQKPWCRQFIISTQPITSSETEALLLEHNSIKLYQPRYNVFIAR